MLCILFLLTSCGGGRNNNNTEIIPNNEVFDVSSFDGTWYGPCMNNVFGYSVKSVLTINQTSEATPEFNGSSSFIDTLVSYPVKDCGVTLESEGVASEINGSLGYRSLKAESTKCINNLKQVTSLFISSVSSGMNVYTEEPEKYFALMQLSGYLKLYPSAGKNEYTSTCLNENGHLILNDIEYAPEFNNSNINFNSIVKTPDNNSTWEVESETYKAGISSYSSVLPGGSYSSLLVSTVDFSQLNGDRVGSTILISSFPNGSGSYTVHDHQVGNNISITVLLPATNHLINVTNENFKSYRTRTELGGTVAVTVDDNGKYHYTITSPIRLKNTESDEIINLKINNLYDFSH